MRQQIGEEKGRYKQGKEDKKEQDGKHIYKCNCAQDTLRR